MAQETWFTRDLPILEAVAEIESEGGWPAAGGVARRTGLDVDEVVRGVKALDAGGYVSVSAYQANGMALDVTLLRPAREAIGQWPAPEALFRR